MKKLIIVVSMVFVFTTVTVAQTKGDVEFGFNVGYNTSTVSTTHDSA